MRIEEATFLGYVYRFAQKLGIEIQGKDCHLSHEVDID